jgi:hypothetical protein
MTPIRIVNRLEAVIGINGTPRRLTAAIECELTAHFGLSSIRASEEAERICPSVARIIADRALESESAGLSAKLVILGTTFDVVAGFCHVLPTDDSGVAAAKRHRTQINELLAAIRGLSFNEFEKFGARVLQEIGASNSHVTPHQGDQGIDFYGSLSLGRFQAIQPPFLRLAHDVVLLFAGQAKHYPNRSIGPEIVRELVGAVSLARTKTFSKSDVDIFDGLALRPHSPLLTLLFTTGEISRGAAHLAESVGVIARSGEQLAVFLADKGVGMQENENGNVVFSRVKFDEWLTHANHASRGADGPEEGA